jgi:hypothetical protein
MIDNLLVFRFVQKRDSFWRHHVLGTDDVDPQWPQVLRPLHVDGFYALSPQAKGKIERTCALERISSLQDARTVLREEVQRYNCRQVHSTIGEIPAVRSERAQRTGKSPFRRFALPQSYKCTKDIFCLYLTRVVDSYRRISLDRPVIELPKVDPDEDIELNLVPDLPRSLLETHTGHKDHRVPSLNLPLSQLPGSF